MLVNEANYVEKTKRNACRLLKPQI